ncbi:hypothetical protein LNP74_05750 [Klebsiella pneumoniae subsp. pneumoniae]|nr:hypothetical protein [Klebsiella pneumoniae subsp. pneumoniae]
MPQHETNQLLVEAAKRENRRAPEGGDPFIFGRGAKSAAGCRRGGGSRSRWCRASPQPPERRPTPVFR